MPDDAYSRIKMLMLSPPGLGRGFTELLPLASPAAGAALTRKVPINVWERPRAVAFTYTASPAVPGRQPVLRYLSPDAQTIIEAPVGAQIGPSGVVNCFAWPGAPAATPPGISVQGDASVTSPAAGAAIASITLTQGTWTITWGVRSSGTTGAGDSNNMQLQQGAAVLLIADVPAGGNNLSQQNAVTIEVPAGGSTISVNAIALATVGAIYTAQITATPGEATSAYAPLPDLLLRSGWSLSLTAIGIQAADQISAAFLLADRFPSGFASGADWEDEEQALADAWRSMISGG